MPDRRPGNTPQRPYLPLSSCHASFSIRIQHKNLVKVVNVASVPVSGKAVGDYCTAERELHPTGTPNFDAVCFHAEQCAEKLIKALLIHLGVTPPRSHDLVALDRLLT